LNGSRAAEVAIEHALDALLSDDEPHATFHDALITAIHVDYVRRRFLAELRVSVGDPDASDEATRERRRSGTLVVEGLSLWTIEPPAAADRSAGAGLWLAADGSLADSPTELGRDLAQRFGHGSVSWFLFFNDQSAFAYLVGERAEFRWL
jgi:hypothetical protein